MKVDRISYQKIFPTGMAYLNHKIGVEIDVSDGDNPEHAFNLAKALVEKWNADSNPSYAMTMEYMKSDGEKLSEINKEKEKIEIAIDNCNSTEELKSFEQDALKHGLVAQYLNKKKEFQR